MTEFSPVSEYLNSILQQAVELRASDVHFESSDNHFKIRYRLDGVLYEAACPPSFLMSSLVAKIKVMAHLNVAEYRRPQDGRFQFQCGEKGVDFRVSTLPIKDGESVVLRLLDPSSIRWTLEQLGMSHECCTMVEQMIHKNHGMLIASGPTGSGKTTTLYACLQKINQPHLKIITVEDPVEYEVEGIEQVNVQDHIGLEFARLLRSFLRHDPDVLMVGEIRDTETAQVSIQAALTGHLVLTSLHANNAISSITRVLNLGVDPHLAASALRGILAQRLVKDPRRQGRTGIFELLSITERMRDLIEQKAPESLLYQQACREGFRSLRENSDYAEIADKVFSCS